VSESLYGNVAGKLLLAISRICRLPFALINSNGILLIWLFTNLTVALFFASVFHNSSDKLEIWLLFLIAHSKR